MSWGIIVTIAMTPMYGKQLLQQVNCTSIFPSPLILNFQERHGFLNVLMYNSIDLFLHEFFHNDLVISLRKYRCFPLFK